MTKSRLGWQAVFLVAVGTLPFSAGAEEGWRFIPRFSLAESYSDNIDLAPVNGKSDYFTSVTPGITIRGSSRRLTTTADYNFENIYFAHNSRFDHSNQLFQGQTTAKIIDHWLDFDATGSMTKEAVDATGQFIPNANSRIGNARDVTNYTLTPRVRHDFAGWLNLDFYYRLNKIDHGGQNSVTGFADNFGDGDEKETYLRLSSGRRIERFPVGVTLQSRDLTHTGGAGNTSNGGKDKMERVLGDVSYVVNHGLKLTASGGVESNTFSGQQGPGTGQSTGKSWALGFTWTPSSHTSLAASYGDRFYGPSFDINLSYRRSRWGISYTYKEELQTFNELFSSLRFVQTRDAAGNLIFDPLSSNNFRNPLNTPTVVNEVFISRDSNLTLNYSWGRNSFNVAFFNSDRDFQASKQTQSTEGTTVNFSRVLTPKTKLGIAAYLRSSTDIGTGSGKPTDFTSISPFVSYQLARNVTAMVNYEYQDSTGSNAINQYTENAVTARISYYY